MGAKIRFCGAIEAVHAYRRVFILWLKADKNPPRSLISSPHSSASGMIHSPFNKPYCMKTLEVLSCPEPTLAAELKIMKIKELERHCRKVLIKLGQGDYGAVMSAVIKAIPMLEANKVGRFKAIQDLIKTLVPDGSKNDGAHAALIERLSIIMTVLIAKKFQKIHGVGG